MMVLDSYYHLITKYRSQLFGISLVWIFFRHTYFYSNFTYGLLDPLVHIGDCGVDVFMFLSGFGLYFSFTKTPNVRKFYKKRVIRILPVVLILLTIFAIFGDIILCKPISTVFSLSYWFFAFYCDYWFIGAILFLYLYYPIIHRLLLKNTSKFASIFVVLGVLGVVVIRQLNIEFFGQLQLYFARIPIFVLGSVFAKNTQLFKKTLIVFLLLICIPGLFILPKEFQRIIYIPVAISFVIYMPYLLRQLPDYVNIALGKLGNVSLEFYLLHVFIFSLGFLSYLSELYSQFVAVFISFGVVLLLSVILNKLVGALVNQLNNVS